MADPDHFDSQGLVDWVDCHVRAFVHFGGAARQLVGDNLRAGISRACCPPSRVKVTTEDCSAGARQNGISGPVEGQARSHLRNGRAQDRSGSGPE